VSVVVPVYNGEPYLAQAIQSIIAQTFVDWDLIVVDDGSSDASLAIAHDFAATDARIHVIAAEHQGEVAARNLGARYATGDWIAVLDADDYAHPRRLEEQLAFAEAHPSVGVIAAMARRVDAAGRDRGLTRQGPTSIEAFRAVRASAGTVGVIHSSALIRRSLLNEVGGYPADYFMAADMALFNLRLAPVTDIVAVDQPLVYRRVHMGQISRRHADLIVEANEVIALNARRLATGQSVLPYLEALHLLESGSVWRRLNRRRRQKRFLWQQRGVAALAAGSPASAFMPLVSVFAISPLWSFGEALRILRERRSAESVIDVPPTAPAVTPPQQAGDGG